jgi:ribose-phosphate pyrophosphokinase
MIIHLDNPNESEIAFKRFQFPDGQPHCEFDPAVVREAAQKEPIDVIGAIKSGDDLLNIALAIEAIDSALKETKLLFPLTLNISYLLGARMDRRIAAGQPASLAVVTSLLNASLRASVFTGVRVLDPHSPVTLAELTQAEALHPDALVAFALSRIKRDECQSPLVVIPDAGAVARTNGILNRLKVDNAIARCSKKRDSQTGKLSGFQLDEGDMSGRVALIVDDICDGGGTFAGIAKVLRAYGAAKVYLCVTHGIFSKGIEIDGIDGVFSTDSYCMSDQAGYEVSHDIGDKSVLMIKREGRVLLTIMTRFMSQILNSNR